VNKSFEASKKFLVELETILENTREELSQAVKDPERYDFRERPPYKIPVHPEPEKMASAAIDLENQNVKVRYEDQKPRENYTCVKHDPINKVAIVEGDTVHDYRDTKICSTMYYLIDGENTWRHTDTGYEKSLQTRPREVAQNFEQLYRQALRENKKENFTQETCDQGLEPVPPPEKDEMFPE